MQISEILVHGKWRYESNQGSGQSTGPGHCSPLKSVSEAENGHGPNTASKSENQVTYIRILLSYSTIVQTNVSLVHRFRDHEWVKYDIVKQIFAEAPSFTLSKIVNTEQGLGVGIDVGFKR